MSAAPRQLWLVRHATPLVAPNTCYGQLDLPADATHTEAAAQALNAALPPQFTLFTSSLLRCQQLAQALSSHRATAPWRTDARLCEMDFGQWEGQCWDAIDRTALDDWASDLAHYHPGGGENLAQMLERVQAALQDAAHLPKAAGDVVWITHAGVARCVQWLLRHGPAHLPSTAEWRLPAPAWGQWLVLNLSAQGD